MKSSNIANVIIGTQWGDEGKGKITDLLAQKVDYIVRYQGGNNAGHTVVVKDKTYKFHLIPSGVVQEKHCLLGNGMVIDPEALISEIEKLEEDGIKLKLSIDPLVSIIMPYHKLLDGISESALQGKKIGTTKRGIGPAYEDKYGRRGIRFIDLLDKVDLEDKIKENFSLKRKIIENVYKQNFRLNRKKIISDYLNYANKLRKYLKDVSLTIYEALENNKKVLFESAQGTFLDVTYGTYPYVTSSHPIAGGIFTDVGIPPQQLNVTGIVKAYTTRVGSGPFLTELTNKTGKLIRKKGNEFGTTTGRPRRCGWLDLEMIKYSKRVNGLDQLAITKIDVLSGMKKIKVAIGYSLRGKKISFPLTISQLEKCKVQYKEFDGFEINPDTKTYQDLPKNAKIYLKFIERYLKIPISIISVGPKRSETIIV